MWELLADLVTPGPTVQLPVEEALRTYLATDVLSRLDFPPFDRSLVDGYAVRCADFRDGRARLRRADLVRAGDAGGQELAHGACIQINTGAPIPTGADAVVMVERMRTADHDLIDLADEPTPGQNIDPRGGLIRAGEVLIPARTRISAGTLAALVSAGIKEVTVFRRPGVALLTTGDELAEPGTTLRSGGIYDSNTVMLAELIRVSGAELRMQERCPDDRAALLRTLRQALQHDVVCVVGGMSKGTHDLIPGVLAELGVGWVVESLNLKPGKPMRIGASAGGGWVIGLPGNPVSCAVCFLLFGHQIIHQRGGSPPRTYTMLQAHTTTPLPANGARPLFQPAWWSVNQRGRATVTPLPWRGSGDPFGLARANALLYRADRAPEVAVGDIVPILALGDA